VSGIGERALPGVASLGVRPTVKLNAAPVLEVHLLEGGGNLYGKHLRVDFLHKFRDEQKFADLDALTYQIAADVAAARAYFVQRSAALPRQGSRVS
jgi:riboflavin kinase/FMN adenylyltransferase